MNDGESVPDLDDLYWFVQVVDHGGFTAAGRALHQPKSSLSKRVAALEARLGTRLIERSSRRFVVTAAGRDVHRHATAMLVEAEAAVDAVRGRLAEPMGTVRVTASMTTARLSLADLLPRLALQHPKIRIELHATNRSVDLIEEGFDIGIRAHFAPLPDSDLVRRRLGRSPVHLVAAPAYLDRCGIPMAPSDIAGHDGLLTARDGTDPVWRLCDAAGAAADARPAPRFHADDPQVLLRAAVAGLGIACLPLALCGPDLETGALRRVLPGWDAGGADITILTPPRRGRLPAVRAVVDALAADLPATMRLDR